MHKSALTTFFIIFIPSAILVFLGLFLFGEQRISDLQQQVSQLDREVMHERELAQFYKESFEIVQDDLLRLSAIYGNRGQYEERIGQIREQELAVIQATFDGREYAIRDAALWPAYAERGVVQLQCLGQPVDAPTRSTIDVTGSGIFALHVDGNKVLDFTDTAAATILLDPGLHEISIISRTGGTIERVAIDGVGAQLTADAGRSWSMFDCQNASVNGALAEAGAVRVALRVA
jgi:hypothetical protein